MQPATDLETILRRELLPGERLLWQGRPNPRKLGAVFVIWLFAVPWTAFSLAWEGGALMPWLAGGKSPDAMRAVFGVVFPLFGLPFVAIGLGLMWLPIRALRRARYTIYGLTDRRVLRVSTGKVREATSVLFDQMGPIDVRADAQGYGTLRIQTGTKLDTDGDRVTERFEVAGVPDVSRLETLLLEQRTHLARR